jgi:hypothetical protein
MSRLGRLPSLIILRTCSDEIRNNASTEFVHRFVEFGSMPCFVGLWELATQPDRRKVLQDAYTVFVNTYTQDLELPGPYLRARFTTNIDETKNAYMSIKQHSAHVYLNFPRSKLIILLESRRFTKLILLA